MKYSDLYKTYLETFNRNHPGVPKFVGDELNRLWFTSDTHFGHMKTLTKAARPFDNTNEMDKEIIKQWNKTVKPNDIIYHLGDFGDLSNLKKLNGRIRLIMGNHERKEGLTKEELLKAGFDEVYETGATIMAGDLLMYLCHEPSKHRNDMFNLFGHLHNLILLKEWGVNVGVDCHHYRPINFERIELYIRLRDNAYKGELFE